MSLATPDAIVVLDDGQFYVELCAELCADLERSHAPGTEGGFLQRRCYVSVTSPGGYECIGSFGRSGDGCWEASIDAPFDPATGSDRRRLACGTSRLDAVVAIWAARHDARCRHMA